MKIRIGHEKEEEEATGGRRVEVIDTRRINRYTLTRNRNGKKLGSIENENEVIVIAWQVDFLSVLLFWVRYLLYHSISIWFPLFGVIN